MPKSRVDIIADLKIQIAEYVKLRRRLGRDMSFIGALRGHRQAIVEALRDTPNDDDLRERLGYIDDLMTQEGIAP